MSVSREETIFVMTLELPESSRPSFLDMACGGDAVMRRRIEALVLAHGDTDGVFKTDIALVTPTVVESVAAGKAPETVGEWIGRYRLVEVLGEGGCGVVYVAEQSEPVRRQVALKVIKLGMDTKQVVARFEAERQALAMMDHPGIAKVFDAGATEAGRPYFVMELLRGARITHYCDAAGLGVRARLELFIKVCQSIQHAHQKGIIHRDIKPSNILVVTQDGEAVAKVIDFGIAKATGGRLTDSTVFTHLNQFMGTPAYMSPEQAEMGGIDIDTRSDIYSLGVVLYELLAGTTPFDPNELAALGFDGIRRTIREREPMRPSVMGRARRLGVAGESSMGQREEVAADLDWIVMKCLEKDRDRRYETANGLAMDLGRFLNNEPVVARPPTPVYRMQKAWRRNRVAFVMTALVGMVLVVSLVVSTRAWVRAEQDRGVAEKARQAEQRHRFRADLERVESQRLLYAANMNLVQQAWEDNNLGRMRQLLSETASSPDKGFEWFYWQRVVHQPLQTFSGHRASVWAVAFSRDGSRVASGGEDRMVRLWDLSESGKHQRWVNPGGTVYSVALTSDGSRLLTADDAGTVGEWEVETGKRVRVLEGHGSRVYSVVVSPKGGRYATASEDKTVRIWDAASGREVMRLSGHQGWVRSVVFSPDGTRVLSGGDDNTARLWDVGNGRELGVLMGHTDRIYAVDWSPDGREVATASWDGTVGVWDSMKFQRRLTLKGHSGWVRSVAYSPDGRRLVSGGEDQVARVWNAQTGELEWVLKGHAARVRWAVFSPDNRRIATASGDETVRMWSADGNRIQRAAIGHRSWVQSLSFSGDGRKIATGGKDASARLWDVGTGETLAVYLGHTGSVNTVELSRDATRLLTASSDGTARVWDAETKRELTRVSSHSGTIWAAAFSPDLGSFATCGSDRETRLWDTSSGKLLREFHGPSEGLYCVSFSKDGSTLATAGEDGIIRLWNVQSGEQWRVLVGHVGMVRRVGFSPDGTRLVSGGLDQVVRIWDVKTGKQLREIRGHRGSILAVGYSMDGRRIASGSDDGTGRLWDAETGRGLIDFKGHDAWVWCIGVSPDGGCVATGGFDQILRLWDSARDRELNRWEHQERLSMRRVREENLADLLVEKGPGHPQLRVARLELGVAMRETGELGAALRALGEVLSEATAAKPRDDAFWIRAMGEMSKCLAMDRQFQVAIDLERQRVVELRRQWPPTHPEVIQSLESMARWNEHLGRNAEAESIHEELAELQMKGSVKELVPR